MMTCQFVSFDTALYRETSNQQPYKDQSSFNNGPKFDVWSNYLVHSTWQRVRVRTTKTDGTAIKNFLIPSSTAVLGTTMFEKQQHDKSWKER
jgi:hypothetical protein